MITDFLAKSISKELSDYERKIILNSSRKPKSWWTLKRHAKIANVSRRDSSHKTFHIWKYDLLWMCEEQPNWGKYYLSFLGQRVKNYIISHPV